MSDLEAVLAHIESNLDAACERSRSTDPAYAQECRASDRLARPGSLRHRPVTVELKQKLGITWCSQVSRSKMTGFTVRTKDMNWKAFDASPAPGTDSARIGTAIGAAARWHQVIEPTGTSPRSCWLRTRHFSR